MKSIEVFISYHQKDEELREELEKHLATLLREQTITSWHDRKIVAGQEFKDEINKSLKRAGLILLLVSPDFIASDYHWTVEVTRALEQNAAGKARVIPVLLRYADWDNPPIDKLSPLPSNRKPIKSWNDRDEAFLEVVKGIRQEVARLVASSNYSPPKDSSANQKPLALKPATDNAPSQPNNQIQTDLTLELPLSIAELTYGTEKKIALDDGSITVTVPSGFSPGKKLRIRGKGKLNPITNQRGDLYLKVVSIQKVEVSLEDYQQKLRRYEQELIKVLQWEYPLSEHSREGLKNYQQMLKLRDEDVTLLEEQVTAQEQEKRQDKVTSLINEANRLNKEKKFEEAAVKYKAALHLDPNSVLAHHNLGFVLHELGRLEEAIASYQTALRLDPNLAMAHNNLGVVLSNQGKLEEAIASYQTALRLDPNNATVHYHLGLALQEQRKLEAAIASYQAALRLDPNHATAHNNLGLALEKQGKLEAASASYQTALRLDPNDAIAHYNLGGVLKKQGKLEAASASYQTALRLDPNFAMAHNNLGSVLEEQGKLEAAIASYRTALRLNPNYVTAHYNLGGVLEKQGKLEAAITSYQTALRLDPNLAMAHNQLSYALYNQGKLEAAITELEIAVRLDPSSALFRENLEFLKNERNSC
ncbi:MULTISPECIES: tetratricopeptide repeat protein [Nostoc]|uniref:Tetratricopeptide repeat protein n=2 Tax=Nostoc TaxID=1177 RepID=A0ABR8IER6_9NOSO|nr:MULTISPECIES: tetratricopeptide repeat protein [Nostoc]MBD2562388.1 tetratricopeptide repeat protein [Nostoc linckia FACHB-391]MBD2648945.1 tetratricopeptide repeat protein [Nostoc foliaceum FACHB-393]